MADTELISGDAPLPEPPPAESTAPVVPPAGGEPTEKSAKPSLREQLQTNFKAAQEPKEKSPARQAAAAAKPREQETGKFKPKETVEAQGAPGEIPQPKKDAQPVASSAIGPPPGWSAESKAAFNALPEHLKADVFKREKEVSDGFKRYSDDAKKYQDIEQVLAPTRAVYQQHGIRSDAEAISRLMQWENTIRSNPAEGIKNLARNFGIDLASLAQSPPGQSNGQDAIAQYIQPVLQQVNSVQSELTNLQQQRAASDIAQFAKDKPYFERVKTTMGQLMQAGLAPDLETAYQKAIGMDSDIRTEMMQKEIDTQLNTHQKEAQAKFDQSRKAAVSPSARAPSGQLNGKEKSKSGIRGSILAAVEEIRESQRA